MRKTLNETKTQVRFPPDVWDAIKRLAVSHERSSNGEIVFAMREYIQKNAHANESSTCAKSSLESLTLQ